MLGAWMSVWITRCWSVVPILFLLALVDLRDETVTHPLGESVYNRLIHVSLSPDARLLLVRYYGRQDPNVVEIWDTRMRKVINRVEYTTRIDVARFCLASRPNVVTSRHFMYEFTQRHKFGSSTVRCWSADTGCPLATFNGHECGILTLTGSTDGRQLITANNDRVKKSE